MEQQGEENCKPKQVEEAGIVFEFSRRDWGRHCVVFRDIVPLFGEEEAGLQKLNL